MIEHIIMDILITRRISEPRRESIINIIAFLCFVTMGCRLETSNIVVLCRSTSHQALSCKEVVNHSFRRLNKLRLMT